jgi:hypothetical protein
VNEEALTQRGAVASKEKFRHKRGRKRLLDKKNG